MAAGPVTTLLQLASGGDRLALHAVYATLYPELKLLARKRLHQQGRAESLNTTTLVHESFVKMVSTRDWHVQDRRHFFAYVAKAMRNIIIDNARELLSERRGGNVQHVCLGHTDVGQQAAPMIDDDVLQVHKALERLERIDAKLAELVEMRYFGGFSELEIAELRGVTTRTLNRQWDKARAWLYVSLREDPPLRSE